jgi:23S rRNA pseudouridine2605 synthase
LQQRLQKALAAAGVASRRHAEALIASGRIAVDGTVVREMGTLVDPDTQTITLDGNPVARPPAIHHYVALHKPAGYVSTVSDRHAPQKVTDLVRLPGVRLVPVGRLDADSEGLLLLSDDGDFVYRVTHPSHSIGKTYLATVKGTPDDDAIERLTRGLRLPGEPRKTAPAGARRAGRGPERGTSLVEMVLHEGRNRQVRRMLDTVGHSVVRLVRTQIGPVTLGNLQPGEWRFLTDDEVAALMTGGTGGSIRPDTPATPSAPRPLSGGAPRGKNAGPPGRPAANKPGGQQPPTSRAPRGGGRAGSGSGAKGATGKEGPPPPRSLPGRRKQDTAAPQPQQQERTQRDETRHHDRPRPGPEQDHRKPAPERLPVHQDRLDRRLSARGQRDASDRLRGQGRRQGRRDHP